MKEEEIYSPYCKICQSCGEIGCCPIFMCENHPEGKYCDMYFNELQDNNEEYTILLDFLRKNEVTKEILDTFFEKYDEIKDGYYQKRKEEIEKEK